MWNFNVTSFTRRGAWKFLRVVLPVHPWPGISDCENERIVLYSLAKRRMKRKDFDLQ